MFPEAYQSIAGKWTPSYRDKAEQDGQPERQIGRILESKVLGRRRVTWVVRVQGMTDMTSTRVSEGGPGRQRIAMAAALGSQAAIATGVTPAVLSDHYRTRVEQVVVLLTERRCVGFGLECARRALPVREAMVPKTR